MKNACARSLQNRGGLLEKASTMHALTKARKRKSRALARKYCFEEGVRGRKGRWR